MPPFAEARAVKLTLVVAGGGPSAGRSLPVKVSPFLIGRAPECHLRPASPTVSNRHCSLWQRPDGFVVRDLGSTNGTFVNGVRVQGEAELHDGDRLQAGPLQFDVKIEGAVPVNRPTPLPPAKAAAPPELEDAAAILLADDGPPAPTASTDAAGVPMGETTLAAPSADKPSEAAKPAAAKSEDTATAADAILKKYMRRPRK